MSLDRAFLAVDGHAGKVADMLVHAGELVEKHGLATVLIAYEGESEFAGHCLWLVVVLTRGELVSVTEGLSFAVGLAVAGMLMA